MMLHFGNHFCYHAANTALDGIIEGLNGLNKALENQSEDPDFILGKVHVQMRFFCIFRRSLLPLWMKPSVLLPKRSLRRSLLICGEAAPQTHVYKNFSNNSFVFKDAYIS